MQDALLTPRQVADLLNIKVKTVYAAASDGRLPVVRLWRGARKTHVRFRRSDIERLLRDRTVRATD